MGLSKIRKPVVAGQFYPSSSEQLKKQIELLIDNKTAKKDAIACMLPHAGYVYSGKVAGQTLSEINIKDTVILLGPNHTGYGAQFSIMTEGVWQTPLGDVTIDSALAKEILQNSKYLKEDTLAHVSEHSLEVELPFLQYFKEDFKIVPIAFLADEVGALKNVGIEIARVIRRLGKEGTITIVASSDMTHYEPKKDAQRKDKEAITAILELNEDKLVEKISELRISMCGYAPVIVMISLAKALGAKSGRLVKYATSGDITGDTDSVVGYAGIVVY